MYGAIALLHDVDCYWEAPGGAIVRYDPATSDIEKLGIPLPHVYIQSICLDEARRVIYGQSFTPERLFRFDLATRQSQDLGAISSGMVMAQCENVELDDDGCVWCGWHATRAWQNTSGVDSHRLCKYDLRTGRIHFLDAGLPNPNGSYSSPLDAHYAHCYSRCLAGEVDFVDVPRTVDVESRMWGGAHPQDLRVELVDAKNHWYTIHKDVKRQLAAGDALPVKYLNATTHNIFDYSAPRDFRRETLFGIIATARQICEQEGATLSAATTAGIAAYRASAGAPAGSQKLALDARGRAGWQTRPVPAAAASN